ncbi:MAG: hypothetical protein RL885_32015 [Planctomycetota bacterium]
MKSLIIKAILWIVGGSVVFVASLFGFLAIQGRTSAKELSRLPILSLFIAAPPGEEEGAEGEEGGPEETDVGAPDAAPSDSVTATSRQGADTTSPAKGPSSGTTMNNGSPFANGELERMAASLRQALQRSSLREQSLDERERTLERIAQDLEERRSQIVALLDDLENEAADLRDERARFQSEMVRVEEAEKANLKKLGEKYQRMGGEDAARVLAQLELGQTVKILSQLEDRAAAKILAAMDPELAAEVTEKLMKLVEGDAEDR